MKVGNRLNIATSTRIVEGCNMNVKLLAAALVALLALYSGSTWAPYIKLPDGTAYPVLDGETGEQALEAAKVKYPEAFGLPKSTEVTSATLQSVSEPRPLDRERARYDTVTELAARTIVAAVLFLILTTGTLKGPRVTPIQTAQWVAAWLGAISVLALQKTSLIASPGDFFLILIGPFLFYYFLGFVGGFLWRKLRPLRATAIASSPSIVTVGDTPDEEYWATALTEFNSTERKTGLWARVFSEAQGNEAMAKASYLKARATELRDEQTAPTYETHVHCLKCGKLNVREAEVCKHCHAAMPTSKLQYEGSNAKNKAERKDKKNVSIFTPDVKYYINLFILFIVFMFGVYYMYTRPGG